MITSTKIKNWLSNYLFCLVKLYFDCRWI